MISDHESQGGAAQAASRLAESFSGTHRVDRLVLFPDRRPHPWRTHVLGTENRVGQALRRVPRKLWPVRFPYPNTPEFVAVQLRGLLRRLRPDVINVHNLHGGADWGWGPHIAAVSAEFAPTVWTLHDMWSFTGRCAYAYDCAKFRVGCDAACPTATESPRLAPEHIASAWHERRRLLAAHPQIVAVAPSCWLAAEALSGQWAGHRVEVVPYGVPTDIIAPVPREEARRRLRLRTEGPVLLVAAHDLTERRKGAELLPQLWRHVRHRPFTLLMMGQGQLAIDDPQICVSPLGWIDDDRVKALAYSAADVLLHPAPVDNFPNVILEAFACGTPAIGLPIGGVSEQIVPGITGWLATDATAAALGDAIKVALDEIQKGVKLGTAARTTAVTQFPLWRQAERYQQLFEELIPQSACVLV